MWSHFPHLRPIDRLSIVLSVETGGVSVKTCFLKGYPDQKAHRGEELTVLFAKSLWRSTGHVQDADHSAFGLNGDAQRGAEALPGARDFGKGV